MVAQFLMHGHQFYVVNQNIIYIQLFSYIFNLIPPHINIHLNFTHEDVSVAQFLMQNHYLYVINQNIIYIQNFIHLQSYAAI